MQFYFFTSVVLQGVGKTKKEAKTKAGKIAFDIILGLMQDPTTPGLCRLNIKQ